MSGARRGPCPTVGVRYNTHTVGVSYTTPLVGVSYNTHTRSTREWWTTVCAELSDHGRAREGGGYMYCTGKITNESGRSLRHGDARGSLRCTTYAD